MIGEVIILALSLAALMFGYGKDTFTMRIKYGIDNVYWRNVPISYDLYYATIWNMKTQNSIQRMCNREYCELIIGDGKYNETKRFGEVFAYESGFSFYILPQNETILKSPERAVVIRRSDEFDQYVLGVYKRGF